MIEAIKEKIQKLTLLTNAEKVEYIEEIHKHVEADDYSKATELYRHLADASLQTHGYAPKLTEFAEAYKPNWDETQCLFQSPEKTKQRCDFSAAWLNKSYPGEKSEYSEPFSEEDAWTLFNLSFNVHGFATEQEFKEFFERAYNFGYAGNSDDLTEEQKTSGFSRLMSINNARSYVTCSCPRCKFDKWIQDGYSLIPFANGIKNFIDIHNTLRKFFPTHVLVKIAGAKQ